MNEIWYNNKNAFSGVSYTPFVSYSQDFDGWWGSNKSFSLIGEIVGCGTDYSGMVGKQNALINNFSQNFKKFEIRQSGSELFKSDYAIVRGINFDESNYAFILPYTVEIEAFDSDIFSGQFFVKEPEDSFEFVENNDGTLSLTHRVSAVGINSSLPAIRNATNFVYSRTGLKNIPSTAFIRINQQSFPILNSISETMDRMNGNCQWVENYTIDQLQTGNGLLRYSVDIGYDKFNFSTATINGTLNAGISGSMDLIRNRYKSLNLWDLTFDIYSGCTNSGDLNSIYVNSGVDEDLSNKQISFSVTFNNDNSPIIYTDSTATYNIGYGSDSENSASLNSNIRCRVGNPIERLAQVNNFFQNSFNPMQEFRKNITGLNNDFNVTHFKQRSESLSENQIDGSLSYSISWDINPINASLPCYIKNISYTVTKTYGLQQYEFVQPLCSDWGAYGTHRSKTTVSFDGQMEVEIGNSAKAKAYIESISNGYAMGIIKSKTFTNETSDGRISFQITWEEN
jgi:hypothetical protein